MSQGRPSTCSWVYAEPTEEEAAKGLGAEVCSRCGVRRTIDYDGEVVAVTGTPEVTPTTKHYARPRTWLNVPRNQN